ncbi:MAG: bifunctional 5,10-methylenetetrahydrofolate dehydrogenase/5,10-methenyltetrahydrofolate cyclohydrolase [Elusimicrobiaceae bacterium]|nr:bifunctional 5,10-methylenetetrahydrofolate dehydrogenase/5,10-methenyltetrahydrofolate cyclohydrolase [Elusimicrobiaceae bacterium]
MILEGKTLAAQLREPLLQRAQRVQERLGRALSLFAVGSSDDYGAYVYLKKEVAAAEKLGVRCQIQPISNHTSTEEFLTLLRKASADPQTDAILIARPLPEHLANSGFEHFIAAEKDIDGMSDVSMGKLFLCKTWEDVESLKTFIPCTALAVMRLLEHHRINPQGLEAAVIGRSPNVGRPLAHLLTCKNATTKICHTYTQDLAFSLQNTHLICSAAGQAGLLTRVNVPAGAIIIDIATNLGPDGNLCGDAQTQDLLEKGCKISPVPGGVGPVTLACLLENIILSGERKI